MTRTPFYAGDPTMMHVDADPGARQIVPTIPLANIARVRVRLGGAFGWMTRGDTTRIEWDIGAITIGHPEGLVVIERAPDPPLDPRIHREPTITRRRAETSVLDLVLPHVPPPAAARALDGLDLNGAIDRDHARRGLAGFVTPPSPRLGALVDRACLRIERATGHSGAAIRSAVADAVQGSVPADQATVLEIARALLTVARTGRGEHGQALLTPEQIADFDTVLGA